MHHTIRHAPSFSCIALGLLTGLAITALPGCSNSRNAAIPPTASLRAQGDGKLVSYTASSDGFAYVEDTTDHKLVWSGEVHTDDMIAVEADHDSVTVAGRIVVNKGIHSDHKYKIYVETASRR